MIEKANGNALPSKSAVWASLDREDREYYASLAREEINEARADLRKLGYSAEDDHPDWPSTENYRKRKIELAWEDHPTVAARKKAENAAYHDSERMKWALGFIRVLTCGECGIKVEAWKAMEAGDVAFCLAPDCARTGIAARIKAEIDSGERTLKSLLMNPNASPGRQLSEEEFARVMSAREATS